MHIFDLPIRNTLENACFEELANLRRIGALRTIRALRTISGPPSGFCFLHPDFVFFREKKQNEKFPTKMKEKIGAPKGRQLYGAPKRVLIMPNSVIRNYCMRSFVFCVFDKLQQVSYIR